MNRAFLLFVSIVLAGCGGGYGTTTQPPTGATMQAGQWEFVATPSTGAKPVYVEADLTLSPGQVTSAHLQTSLFQFGGPIGGGVFSDCVGYDLYASVANGILGGMSTPNVGVLEAQPSPAEANFSATIASNGQSVSGGSYTDYASFCGFESAKTSGTFTGYIVTPLNGTFSGTLSGTSSDQITIQITQDSNFGITATGTSVRAGVTTNLSISPAVSSANSNIIGATVQGNGTASNVNGNTTFQVFGHLNPAGTQIQIVGNFNWGTETGTLTKQ
jgi:hypothetical protein